MPAGRAAGVKDHRPGALFLQPAVDIPDQLPTLFPAGLGGLTVERRFELAIAITGKVAVGIAGIAFVEWLVWVVDHCGGGVFHPDHVVAPGHLRGRRVIESLSRYPETPEKVVVELGSDGYALLGSDEAVATSDARKFLSVALGSENQQTNLGTTRKRLVEICLKIGLGDAGHGQ